MIRRKLILHIALIVGLALVVASVIAIAVLHSRAFHRYVMAQIVRRASQATGARVEVGEFQIRWSGLRVDLYQIAVHGTEPASGPPLLKLDHLRVGLKIVSLWQRKIDLTELVVDHPSIHLSVDQKGRTNLPPAAPAAAGSRPANVFDLAIANFAVSHGELDYRDRHIPLDGEVHDLQAQVTFNSAKNECEGALGYRHGRIQVGRFNPVQHGVRVNFGATPAGLTIHSLVLDAGSSTMSVQAHVQDYSDPSVDGAYQADLSTSEVGSFLKLTAFPAGRVNIQGTLHFGNRDDRPFLDNLVIAGQFRSPAMAVHLPQGRVSVRALNGNFRLSDGTLEARNLRGEVLGGRVYGEVTLSHLGEHPVARVAATVRDVSLESASNALDAKPLNRTAISGRLNGTMKGSWVGSGNDLQLRTDATIAASAPVRQGSAPGTTSIPLRGDLHLAYDGRNGVITVSHSVLASSHFSANIDGSTGKQSSLAIQAQSDDLREVDRLVLAARSVVAGGYPSAQSPLEPLGIGGSASLDGKLRGSMRDIRLTAQLSSTHLQFRGVTLNDFRAGVALSASQLTLSKGELQTGDQGQVQFEVSAGLKNWVYSPQNPLSLEITAAKMHVATLQQLANAHYPVTGTVAAHVSLHGSQSNVIGQGTVTLTQGTAWNQPIQNLGIEFQGAGATIHSTLQVSAPAGSGSGKLSYDFRNQGYDAQFSLPNLQAQRLPLISQGKVQVGGRVAVAFQGRGTLKDPQLTATLQAPKLQIGQKTFDGLKVRANVAHQRATFTLDSSAAGASVQAQGAIALNADYEATASINVRNIQLGPMLTALLPQAPSGLHGAAELHGSLHGPLKRREQIQAEVEIPTLNLAYQSLQIGNATPIRAVYHGGVVSLETCKLRGTGTELQIQASVPLERDRNLQAAVTGNIDLHLIRLLYPDWDSSGQLGLDVSAQGTFANPAIQGVVRVVNAAFEPPGVPLGAQKVNATLAVHNGRIDIQNFTGEAGGGTLSADGFAIFQPALQFNVRLTAEKVRLRYPLGTRAILDSRLLLTGSRDSALVSGQVMIDRLSLTKQFDVSTFAEQFTGTSATAGGTSWAQRVRLNIGLRSANEMAVSSSKLSVQGSVNLTVQGTAATPVVLGRTDITDGEIFFNGQRYTVQNGVVQFVNIVQTEPVVNLHVTTTVDQFNLTLNLVGPIDRMRVTYTSDPPLAPIDIINLLATGHTTEAASANPTTPESVIAGQLTSQFSNRVEKLAGISSLTIDPQVGSGQGNGSGRLAIQQRVTKNLFFTFTTDLTNSTGQFVQVEYQITRKFAVSTIRDQNGGYTVQVKVHKSF